MDKQEIAQLLLFALIFFWIWLGLKTFIPKRKKTKLSRVRCIRLEINKDGKAVIEFERVVEPFNARQTRIYLVSEISHYSRSRVESILRKNQTTVSIYYDTFRVYSHFNF